MKSAHAAAYTQNLFATSGLPDIGDVVKLTGRPRQIETI